MPHRNIALLIALALLLAACTAPEPTPLPAESFPTPTPPPPTPTITPTPTPFLTPTPTFAPRDYVIYRHETGVFTLTLPDDWETLDTSTDRRLVVRFLPPAGYGSRVSIRVTNQGGALPPEEFTEAADAFIRENYDTTYTETGREALGDNGLVVSFAYDDGRGGVGQERLLARQNGPFLSLMRLFLADADRPLLADAMENIANSYSVDTQVAWGGGVAAINPAELPIVNTQLWRDRDGTTYYMGQIVNASPADISSLGFQVTFCNEADIVLAEVNADADISYVVQGGAVPFRIERDNLPDGVQVCFQEANAVPATPDPTTVYGLSLDTSVGTPNGNLTVTGTVTNSTLTPVADIRIVIAIETGDGQVIGYEVVELGFDVVLEPGQSTNFEQVVEPLGGTAEQYRVLSSAQVIGDTESSIAP